MADARDFDTTVLVIKFPADENSSISDIDVPIPITDDPVDEAESQFFYIVLEIANATNLDLVDTDEQTINVALCNIRDDDSKYSFNSDCYINYCSSYIAIRIGFQLDCYTYFEPKGVALITNVTIVKEANGISEQQYSVGVTVSSPTTGVNPATLNTDEVPGDYDLGFPGVSFRQLPFPANRQEITFTFFLFGDETAEGTEAFRAIISTVEGTPTFQDPNIASLTTMIKIMDDDGKWNTLKSVRSHSMHFCI